MTSDGKAERRVSERFATLDGLRGIAALAVVAYHEAPWLGTFTPRGGFLAVDLFFVLSGFVIADAYGGKIAAGALTPLGFLRVRAIRLYPLFLLGLVLGAGVALLSLAEHRRIIPVMVDAWRSFLPGLVMLPCPPSSTTTALYPLDSVFWTLLFELLVNILFAFTRRFWTFGGIAVVMAVSGAVIVAHRELGFDGWNWGSFGMDIARVMYSFPAGVMIWRLHRRGWRLPPLLSIAVVVALPLCFLSGAAVAVLLATLLFFPLIVWLGAQTEPWELMRGRFKKFGDASYAIYALHLPILDLAIAALLKSRLEWLDMAAALVFAATMIGVALLADKLYDGPARRLLEHLTDG